MRLPRRRYLALVVTGLCGCATVAPEIDTRGMEPPVRELIAERRAALNAAPGADTWGALGDALLAHDLDADAAGCYARAAELTDDPFEWLYLQALASGRGSPETEALLRRALEERPDHALVELRLGLWSQTTVRDEEAADWFERAASHDPELQRALRGLGQSRLALEQHQGAIEALERALVLDSRDAAAWSALAQAYAAIGMHAPAREAARRARRGAERPGFEDPIRLSHVVQTGVSAARRFERAQHALGAGDTAEARVQVEAILALRPDDPDAHFLLASIEAAEGNEAVALGRFELALELDPDHVRALLAWADLAQRSGRVGEARDRIEHAHAVTPADPTILLALAENRRRANDLPGVLEAYLRVVERLPDSADARYNLGVIYERMGKTQLAIEAYRDSVALDPASPAAGELGRLER
ncbi:MAG: tetratricopeptide repeat protein [Acidobacteria bacterium]|nr:tetratricopeptide repeat protein [Acidobacteriota bacterium]NIM60688.1 tetratricopeptide repeat protein [Acidobacteriota bacterium]NIO58648.1 tetratricopeptide repeat protein [Acidobacteriota bacterium]NIQ29704.1 tetratricopeptide repeat protein [Acidobacteriota bacterium]NIQ84421.1 tetratricopeptide repeat protein [Acidobacteriota bacterium]